MWVESIHKQSHVSNSDTLLTDFGRRSFCVCLPKDNEKKTNEINRIIKKDKNIVG